MKYPQNHSSEQHDAAASIIDAARESLVSFGVSLPGSRFPFTYHHDHVREDVGAAVSRSTVARFLTRWSLCRDEADVASVYAWEAITGAVTWLERNRILERSQLPQSVLDGMETHRARRINYGLLDFTRDELTLSDDDAPPFDHAPRFHAVFA